MPPSVPPPPFFFPSPFLPFPVLLQGDHIALGVTPRIVSNSGKVPVMGSQRRTWGDCRDTQQPEPGLLLGCLFFFRGSGLRVSCNLQYLKLLVVNEKKVFF